MSLPWQPMYQRVHSQGDEQIEALQTDVMRFMAIIGLCLMAIFSMVQNAPKSPIEQTPQLDSKALLADEIKILEINSEYLLDKISRLEARLQKNLESTHQHIKTQQQRFKKMNHTLKENKKTLIEMRKTLHKEQHFQKKQQQAIEKVAPVQKTIKPPVKKGFSLRFSSNKALLSLLKQQPVNLYIMMKQNAWHLQKTGKNWKANSTALPQQYYQMSVETVPYMLKQTVKQQLSVHDNSDVIWGIHLPGAMMQSIQGLMKNNSGGEIVINQAGQVTLD